MGIVRGLLSKIGLGESVGPRGRVRVFLLDDDTLRHEWFARQFKGDSVDVAADAARAVEMLSSNYYDVIFLDHDLLPEHYYAEEFDDERSGYAVVTAGDGRTACRGSRSSGGQGSRQSSSTGTPITSHARSATRRCPSAVRCSRSALHARGSRSTRIDHRSTT